MKTLLEFDYKKATQAINYFTKQEGGQIEKLKLIKLVYLADRFHLRKYGRPIMNDTYLAMPLGPVGSSVKDIAEFSSFLAEEEVEYAGKFISRGPRANTVVSVSDVDSNIFSQSEIEALNFAYQEFGSYRASQLVDITHIYPEWSKFKNALESKETTRESMNYSDFFKDPTNNSNGFSMKQEALEASKELFEDHYKVAEYWK
ncbi:MAG: Panacea domain-containing protein [Minisyncoccia bacterium]